MTDSEVLTEDDLHTIFKDLQISVYCKAARVVSYTDSEHPTSTTNIEDARENQECKIFASSVTSFSTPKSKALMVKPTSDGNLSNHEVFNRGPKIYSTFIVKDEVPENSVTTQKLLQLCDMERFLTVERVMRERIQNMEENDKLIHDNLEHLKQARLQEISARRLLLEQKILDYIHDQELKNRPRREAQLAEDNLKSAQRVLERIQRVRDAENEARKKSEALQLQRQHFQKIFDCQKEYGQHYKEILLLISSCENKKILSEKSNNLMKELKNLSLEYENLIKNAKTSNVTEEDVNAAVKLLDSMQKLHKNWKKQLDIINEEAKKKVEVKEESVEQEKQVKADENTKSTDKSDLSDCFDSQSLNTYIRLKNYLEDFDKRCKGLMEDNAMKKFRFYCQKAVNIPVNAISPVSSAHLSNKYFKLYNLLSGKLVDAGGVQVCASEHPDGIAFCKKLLAKKFVRQGDFTVSSKPNAAFSIAAVLASLWLDFPDFGQLTLAYFQSSCPYLAPVFLPQVEGQSTEEYYKSLGYHYTENGDVEKQDSFLKRMSGIMRLYAAVFISKVRQPGKQNPLGISEGWRWISAILNLEPKPDICATLLFDFLEVAGNEMFRAYGAQFKKLLAYICQVYYPKLEKITPVSSGGPLVRLEQFLQKIMKNESIPPPDGLLPPNFW